MHLILSFLSLGRPIVESKGMGDKFLVTIFSKSLYQYCWSLQYASRYPFPFERPEERRERIPNDELERQRPRAYERGRKEEPFITISM